MIPGHGRRARGNGPEAPNEVQEVDEVVDEEEVQDDEEEIFELLALTQWLVKPITICQITEINVISKLSPLPNH